MFCPGLQFRERLASGELLKLTFSSNLVVIFLNNMECDYISFSSLVKNSFQISASLTEIKLFVLVKENFLYLKLPPGNWVGYLRVGVQKRY